MQFCESSWDNEGWGIFIQLSELSYFQFGVNHWYAMVVNNLNNLLHTHLTRTVLLLTSQVSVEILQLN